MDLKYIEVLALDFCGILLELLSIFISCRIIAGKHKIFTGYKKIAVLSVFAVKAATIFMPIPIVNLSATVICTFIVAFFIYKITVIKIIFMEAVFMALMYVGDMITTMILMQIFDSSYSQTIEVSLYRITGVFISILTNDGLVIAASFVLRRKIRDLPPKYWLFTVMCPFLSYAVLFIIDLILMHSDIMNPLFLIIPIIIFLYLNYIVFDFFDTYSKNIEYRSMKIADEQSRENYKILEETENEVRILRHDLNNHINVMERLSEQQDMTELRKYIAEMKASVERTSSYIYTKNQALDSIINIKARKAENNGLKFSVKIEDNIDIKINPMDIVTVLGNALDNAIEANRLGGFVAVDIHENNSYLAFKITNSAKEPKQSAAGYETSKQDKKNHGFGMRSIKNTVKKYNGDIHTEYKNDIFYLDIFMENMSFVPK
jgi:two-component system sensor histidine kinase AgrC